MSSQLEPSLRLVKVSKDLAEEPSDNAHGATAEGSAEAPTASLAPAHDAVSGGVSGEIRSERKSHANNSFTETLIGVPAFPALHDTTVDGTPAPDKLVDGIPSVPKMVDGAPLFVSPITVEAIAKAKNRPTEPSIKVNLDAPPLTEAEKERAKAFNKRKSERVQAFAKVKGGQAETAAPADGLAPIVKLPTGRHDVVKDVEGPKPQKWQSFENLGLAPKPFTRKAQKVVVSMYRLLGFGILTLIVAVLVGYIATTAFYYFNRTWVTPIALSSNDDKVVGLQGQLASQLNEREKLVADLADAERAINAEQNFQMQFAKAIKRDASGRKAALDRVRDLATTAAETRQKIRSTNEEFSSMAATKIDGDYEARVIDHNSLIAGKYQLAQISSANLSLAERQAAFDERAAELAAQTASLDAILGDKSSSAVLSYDVLQIARDYEASKLALARELGNRARLQAAIGRQDKIISGIEGSAYLRAASNGATVAMVPYSNLSNVTKGTKLYACKLNMLWCREVGQVVDVLPGEVQVKHPTRDNILRGRMIELKMTDAAAAQEEVLFAGGAPLGL
jgi:hypothetical protein